MFTMSLGTFLLPALCFLGAVIPRGLQYVTFSHNTTKFLHLTIDSESGTLYLGATNFLFQLTSDLMMESAVQTGPVLDSKDCLPPVSKLECPQAHNTDNHNKLLLVNSVQEELIVCGSVHQGICEKRSLRSIDHILFRPESPGDTQYVAANDPNITTVGLVGHSKDDVPLLFVGRGYTSRGVGGGIPPITTRNLRAHGGDMQGADSHSIFSYEETAKLAVGRLSEYNHHFIKSFTYRSSVYFLFYRRDLKSQSREYKTYISRICLDDSHYYSYVELPLLCRSKEKTYSLLQAAYVTQPGSDLRRGRFSTQGEVLFTAFSAWQASSGRLSEESALCVYSMEEVDQLITRTRDVCYTKDGKSEKGIEVAYIEYDVSSNCVQLPADTLDAYPCGSDHTPSPMASRVPLETAPILEEPEARLTAVAVNVEDGHTIAFLGDSRGQLHKVYLGAMGDANTYASLVIHLNSMVSGDLLFDQSQQHLYVMTQPMVVKVPILECSQYLDCESCLTLKDPYCGWCVLQGRCSRRSECSRSIVSEQWLWSFNSTQQCLSIQSLSPANISREEKRNIFLTILDLPSLHEEEAYSCYFEDYESPAVLTESGIVCPSPDPSQAPALKTGTEHITIKLVVRFHNVFIASVDFSFYDCAAVALQWKSAPCQGCVSSHWGCNWCIHQHLCTHKATCEEGTIIYNERTQIPTSSPFLSSAASTTMTSTNTLTVATKPITPPVTMVVTHTPITESVPTTLPAVSAMTAHPTGTFSHTHASTPTTAILTFLKITTESTVLPLTAEPTTTSLAINPTVASVTTSPAETADHTARPTSELATAPEVWFTDPPTTAAFNTLQPVVAALTPPPDITNSTWPPTTTLPTSEAPTSAIPSPFTPNQTSSAPASSADFPGDLKTELPPSEVPSSVLPDWLLGEGTELKDIEDWMDSLQTENDTSPFSASTLLSGDGDSSERDAPDFPRILHPDFDYQYDAPGFLELNEEFSWGPGACPCVQGIQGSSLLPVNVEQKITLLGKNFHLYQDQQWDYECVLIVEGRTVVMDAYVEGEEANRSLCYITCQLHQYSYLAPQLEFNAVVFVQRKQHLRVDSAVDLYVTLYNCSMGHSDCSRCQTADSKYNCVWCGGERPSCIFRGSCTEEIADICPAPLIYSVYPLSGPVEGGTRLTIAGSNLGQKHQDIAETVTVAGIPCAVDAQEYEISSSIVCITGGSWAERSGHIAVEVPGGGHGVSGHIFAYQNPDLKSVAPSQGPKAGGTCLTLLGSKLLTGRPSEISVLIGDLPCHIFSEMQENQLQCQTSPSNMSVELPVTIKYGHTERRLEGFLFKYTLDPNITFAEPAKSFLSGGRVIRVHGHNLDVVQNPKIRITISPSERRRRGLGRWRRIMPETECSQNALCSIQQFEELCLINSSYLVLCKTPAINLLLRIVQVKLEFILDNLSFDFKSLHPTPFSYEVNPILKPLNAEDPAKPYRHKPGSVISVEGENLDLAISKEEVVAMIGEGVCVVKTLTRNHLYCEPPSEQPAPRHRTKLEGTDSLPEFTVQMGNLNFLLGRVQYDTESQLTFPLEAQIGLGVGASFVALIVLIIVFIYRRKSKQALRDYKKVQIQLENLETSVRDRCKKEFTDLMTEMMDLTSDLVGTGIPFLDYRSYAERIFFPGHRESPLQRGLDVPECRRQTVEQGLVQLSNLLNSKLFLTKFIHTLEIQRTFSPRDRAYVASLLTVSLHGKLEYFTDILKTLLNDLVEQYVAKNPKLMLRRTETVVEKLLTNWMSICLYAFVRDSVGEPLYMLFRGIKHQVDKGPVDWVTGKAKYTLNDNRLLREDLEYRTLTLNALTQAEATGGEAEDSQGVSVKVLDCDTITQVKEKILDQIYKATPYCHRPDPDSLDLEWRSGLAGHLILSDEDVTSVIQGTWKRLNTLQHYKVPDGATVALVPRLTKHIPRENQDYIPGEKTPMLEDADEGGIKLWHLVKPTEEPELPKHRRGSLRDRERAKAIPEIYLTRLLSMKGTLQKFVDDLFQVILSTSRPVPLAVKYFFDLLDDQAMHHGILDPETIHIWKTNSLPLRFWINIIKNPQFVFDVQTSDNVDAVLLVIAQTFMDSCTIADHKLGRDSPINKLLYARDIPRYKQMVERYYADIRQTISASDQEMNSALAELSRNYSGELNSVVALHELYKYINKYYDQIITALEEDPTAQKMQLGYRLQQIAAAVENKVTDL
ncbi:plexin-B1 isoform X1 [Trachemys scripta elegans]|uniref:plexin-B1 isoform X1 n=2 Tax=Trachemys scripta elegans TaxID=31138 RepID=UPI001554DBC2|nr:plexin-B1 isoform X1 [Trachemys scripta elegans]XP_034631709.1 plexin-B1 isoform X1 [Trachemys scripta elegans]XP_034631710.1 plexin-B1 isoform X1 [Trachemys scripta elegans]XP_034631711.1 plexin-B1 isoform X1 [Trachemys scripta elegans]XP_034631713.1 plexin-B1 isoform X1 [Trachemys scripta elegans]XP_034631714.1 plexin-B1 isoform X1 [Trachemys scripta elegans]XP_034631715.1 plexin-B1 isoform X1 [Trachemys scripta elegans]